MTLKTKKLLNIAAGVMFRVGGLGIGSSIILGSAVVWITNMVIIACAFYIEQDED